MVTLVLLWMRRLLTLFYFDFCYFGFLLLFFPQKVYFFSRVDSKVGYPYSCLPVLSGDAIYSSTSSRKKQQQKTAADILMY